MEHNNTLVKYIQENLVDMNNESLVKEIYKQNLPEIIVDYTNNPYGEIKINLNFLVLSIIWEPIIAKKIETKLVLIDNKKILKKEFRNLNRPSDI